MPTTARKQPSVLHFMQQWLPLSEPFVYGIVSHVRRDGAVVSARALENTDVFPYRPAVSLRLLPQGSKFEYHLFTRALSLLARRYSSAIVHVHHGYVAYLAVGACQRRRMPLVVSLHGHDITGALEHDPAMYDPVKHTVDAVVVPSRFLAGVTADAGFPPDRIQVIPSGVDTSLFTPSPLPDNNEVLFVGRFVPKKGLDVLVKAWPSVRAAIPNARLRILGFGPLEGLARSAGEGVDVRVRPDHQEVRAAMEEARVVVSPSRTAEDDSVESLLIVNLEAQATGRPVVTTRHGGIPEYVQDGETAVVVPENDPKALAEALVAVLQDREMARRLAANGPAFASRFDVAACAYKLDDLYDSLLSR